MIAVAAAFATACQAYATSALAARFLAQANAAGDHKERVRNIANGSRRESALLNCMLLPEDTWRSVGSLLYDV